MIKRNPLPMPANKHLFLNLTEGHVRVFKNDEKFPFLAGFDSNPTPVKYVSFATWDSTIEYYFNCTDNIQSNNTTNNCRDDCDSNEYTVSQMKPLSSDSISGKLRILILKFIEMF